MEETLSSNTATITRSRPKPLNFDLDQREQEMLHRQNLAIRAMQEASTTHITDIDARNMLFAADQARTTGWLNVHNDSDYDDCSLPSTQPDALSATYAVQHQVHAAHIRDAPATTQSSTPHVLRTPLEFYTAAAPHDPLAVDPFTYGTSAPQTSPRPLVYPRAPMPTSYHN